MGLLYSKEIPISDIIKISIPTVGEVYDNESDYYGLVSLLTATPSDLMVQLDDIGKDFTKIDRFELFASVLFPEIQKRDTRLIFGDLDLSNFVFGINPQNNNFMLKDVEKGIVIDKVVYDKISRALRKINFIEKKDKPPANEEARKFMIERMRKKQQRALKKMQESQLDSLILAMVNTKEYHYNFDSTRELSIFQFNACVRQVIKKINYDNTMIGCYAGTINTENLSADQLNWLS